MPAPAYPIPASLPPLHLYRHMLREVSYLPPAFRITINATVRERFRRSRADGEHTTSRLARGRGVLRKLRAANAGDKSAMEGLMMKGFGRAGNRRRELMAQLVKPQGPSDTQELEAIIDKGQPSTKQRKTKNAFFERWDQPKLLQLLKSQREQQKDTKGTTSWPGTAVKSTDPDQFVPKTNIWGKSPVDGLVRTKRAHWWRRNADKIMPPLGSGEWDLLQLLGRGAQQQGEWIVPQRRKYIQDGAQQQPWDWKEHMSQPASTLEKPQSRSQQRRTGEVDQGPYAARSRNQDISDRWFRRAYNRTWQLTPRMEQDPNTLKHSITWGKARSALPTASTAQQEIFKGVDSRGNKKL